MKTAGNKKARQLNQMRIILQSALFGEKFLLDLGEKDKLKLIKIHAEKFMEN